MSGEVSGGVRDCLGHFERICSSAEAKAAAIDGVERRFNPRTLKDIPLICVVGEVVTLEAHLATGLRGGVIHHRIQKNLTSQ